MLPLEEVCGSIDHGAQEGNVWAKRFSQRKEFICQAARQEDRRQNSDQSSLTKAQGKFKGMRFSGDYTYS